MCVNIIQFLLALLLVTSANAYYYSQDFNNASTVSNEYNLNFRYGRGGVITGCATGSSVSISGGVCRFSGRVNDSDVDYIGTWVGRMVKYTQQRFTASEYKPFGVEIVRKRARLDPQQEVNSPNNPESFRHLNAFSFWFFVETGLNNSSPEGSSYQDYILIYEMMRDVFNLKDPTDDHSKPYSTWGKYISSESRFNLTSCQRADGIRTINLLVSSYSNYNLEWCYENNYGKGTGDGSLDGTPNSPSTNTNVIGILLTHNGSRVDFYINPNYNNDPANPYPDEYIYLGSAGVGWYSNISFMFGHEAKRYDTEMEFFEIDSVLIREVCSNSLAEIFPEETVTNKTINFTIIITNIIQPDDAGIGEVEIVKPAGFSAWDISSIKVYTYYGTGTSSTNIPSLRLLSNTTSGTLASQGFALIRTNGDSLFIRFCQGTPFSPASNVITYDTPDKRIEVQFKLTTPSQPHPDGSEFKVYVNCKKYYGATYSRYATTGKKRCYSGNATDLWSNDSLKVKVYANVQAVASITPNEIYEGTDNVFYYTLVTDSTNPGPYITKLEIEIPAGFNISSQDVTSIRISDDDTYAYVTNNKIVIDYAGDGNIFPAQSGLDKITINAHGTPNITAETTVIWRSIVYSSVPGTTPVYTTTNEFYPSQKVLIRLEPPDAVAYILPSQIYNNTKYNTFQYIVENQGNTGNNIEKVKIILPDVFTNADNFSSTLCSSTCFTAVFGATNYILVDYTLDGTNLPAGAQDTISFTLYDTIPSLSPPTNYSFPSYADNGNGDGFVPVNESPYTWDVSVISPDPEGVGSIFKLTNNASSTSTKSFYTSDISNTFQYKIQNSAGADSENDIKIARIIIPSSFTQIYNVSSTKIVNDASDIKVTNNTIVLYYTNDGNLEPGQLDKITFSVKDNITTPANYTFELEVANGKNNYAWYSTGNLGAENKIVSAEYPPLMAEAYIKTVDDPNNIIDSSTITNSIFYYVTNYGDLGNDIQEIRIYFPTNGSIVKCIDIDSEIVTNSLNERWVDSGKYIFINYANEGKRLYGKSKDKITFKLIDNITGNTSFKVYIKAKNDREEDYLPTVSGKTQWLFVQIPPAYGKGAIFPTSILVVPPGTKTTNILTYDVENYGKGSNSLKKARILIPTAFINKVQNATSSHITNDATSITVTSSYIELDYQAESNPLPAGTTDTVTFELINEQTNTGTYTWELEVDNGDGNGYVSTLTITNRTKVLSVIRKANSAISTNYSDYATNNKILTTVTRSTLYFKITHTGGTLDIQRSKIYIPYPFVTNSIAVNPNFSGTSGAVWKLTNSGGSNFVLIDYPAGDFTSGEDNIIELKINDNWTSGETNVSFKAWVDYGDGNGFIETDTAENSTLKITFSFPPLSAEGYSTPENIMIDKDYSIYTIYITNTDPSGNNIQLIKINLPAVLTNITSYSSYLCGTNITYNKTNNYLLLNYISWGTQIPPDSIDKIAFTAYDSVTTPYTDQFIVKGANSTNQADLVELSPVSGKSFDIIFYHPGYSSGVYITPNSSLSTTSSNVYHYYILNTGSGTNHITYAEIYFQTNIYITNNIQISDNFNADITVQNGKIILDYQANSTNIKPGENDIVTITIFDKIKYSEPQATWNCKVKYNTSFNYLKDPDVVSGKSIKVDFTMPQPESSIVSLKPAEIPYTRNSFQLNLKVTNTGEGSNDIFGLFITIPSQFTQGLTSSKITSAKASSIDYLNGKFSLYYTNFYVNTSDTITIDLTNQLSQAGTYTLMIVASNSLKTADTGGEKNFSLCVPPSAYIEPDFVYSTAISNLFTIYVVNNGTISSSIKKVRIYYPDIITNISYATSAKLNNQANISILTGSNLIEIDYANDGTEINTGEQDTINLVCFDSIKRGYTNTEWQVYADTGEGFFKTIIGAGKSLNVEFGMPLINAQAYVIPEYAYTTDKSNEFVLKVINNGETYNNILKLKIEPSYPVTNIYFISNSILCSITNKETYIELNYESSNSFIASGQTDTIYIKCFKPYTSATQIVFKIYGDNGHTNGYQKIPAPPDKTLTVEVQVPPDTAETYLLSPYVYTIYTNYSINYYIWNRSSSLPVKNVEITFYTDILKIKKLSSTYLASNEIEFVSNKIILCYSNSVNGNLNPLTTDKLTIEVEYNYSGYTQFSIESLVTIGTSVITGIVPPDGYGKIIITNANWGIVKGYVFPLKQNINIKVIDDQEITVSDVDGNSLITLNNPDTGYFELSKIPPGTYYLVFESERLKKYSYKFTIQAGEIINLSEIRLHNKPLRADATYEQIVYSYDDYKTYAKFPSESFNDDFSLDIYIELMKDPDQIRDFKSSSYIKKTSYDKIYVYRFEMKNIQEAEIDGVKLKKDGELKLYYNEDMVKNAGWNENNLCIYYYRESTGKWIPIGGVVNKEENSITTHINFLAHYYAVFEREIVNEKGKLYNVMVSPRIFTPGRGGNEYDSVKISFQLKEPVSQYTVKIFDTSGRLLKEITRSGEYSQGFVYWDATDNDGRKVKSGVYIYEIKAGDERYRGTIMVVR